MAKAKKQNTELTPKSNIFLIGEGLTERCYFQHIKRKYGIKNLQIKPRFFQNSKSSIDGLGKKINDLLNHIGKNDDEYKIICVFDADVANKDSKIKQKFNELKQKYKKNKNIIICDSLPSIEFWFLIHFEKTNKFFTTKSIEKELKKHIPNYDKTETFLENPYWVNDLCSNNKLYEAINYSKTLKQETTSSYTNIHKAFSLLEIKNKEN
ncbi:MAG: RloB family protein [Bacteroidales bacterium]|jgi:hypothetical protein|nr:RloB family protein [Bacteroidales bacterium]